MGEHLRELTSAEVGVFTLEEKRGGDFDDKPTRIDGRKG
jgi:hypothetical protein